MYECVAVFYDFLLANNLVEIMPYILLVVFCVLFWFALINFLKFRECDYD